MIAGLTGCLYETQDVSSTRCYSSFQSSLVLPYVIYLLMGNEMLEAITRYIFTALLRPCGSNYRNHWTSGGNGRLSFLMVFTYFVVLLSEGYTVV